MPIEEPLQVAVLGDGVAATACALRLARSGHRPVIVARRARSMRRGHGFLLDDASRNALRALGLDGARVAALGTPLARYEQRLPHGEVVHLAPLAPGTFGVMRAALMAALVEALPPAVARRDADVTGLVRDDAGRTRAATLDDGAACDADLFVGCDGARSVVRGALFPACQLTTTPDVELVGHVRDAALARRLGASFVKYQHPEGGRALGLVPCGDDHVVWYIQRALGPDAAAAPVGPAALRAFARDTVAGWDPALLAVLDGADFGHVYRARVADLEPLPRLHVANAVLVGDAAHLFLPFASQGVRFALDDALALGDALDARPLADALAAYEAARRGPIARTVAAGRALRARFVAPPDDTCTVPLADVEPSPFRDEAVPRALLRARAYNLRWATLPPDVIPLTAADPDFAVAPAVRDAVSRYAAGGVFSYGPAEGLPAFREACAHVMRTRKGVAVDAARVLAVDSAAAGMRHVARLALRPGDEAIIFDPVDFLFKAAVEDAGGTVRLLSLDASTGRIDFDALARLVTPRTRMLGVCNPHNPAGRVFTRAELLRLGDFAVDHGLTILDDGVWSDIVYEPGTYVAMASLSPAIAARTFSVHGFSKTFGLAGLRVGYVVAPSERAFDALVDASAARTTMTGAATLSQVAATAAYTEAWPWAERFLAHLRAMRDLAHGRLAALPGVTCARPEGTYVLFPDTRAAGLPSEELAARLLREARVAVVPGAARWFGPGAEGRLRVVFSTAEGILREALDRIEGAWARVLEAPRG